MIIMHTYMKSGELDELLKVSLNLKILGRIFPQIPTFSAAYEKLARPSSP